MKGQIHQPEIRIGIGIGSRPPSPHRRPKTYELPQTEQKYQQIYDIDAYCLYGKIPQAAHSAA